MRGIDAARRGFVTALVASVLLLPTALRAAEPYEGAWARKVRDCKDQDGMTSLTVIDHKVNIDGKLLAMVEQYENHCFINKTATVGNDTTLNATCYEFWDDHKKKVNGRNATIKLSLLSRDKLKVDGTAYLRCPAKKEDTKKKS